MAFRASTQDDPVAGAIELLWTGHPAEALAELEAREATPRIRALRADCARAGLAR